MLCEVKKDVDMVYDIALGYTSYAIVWLWAIKQNL